MVGVLLPPSIAGADQLVQSMPIQSVGCRSGYGCDRIMEMLDVLGISTPYHPDGADLPVASGAVPSTGADDRHQGSRALEENSKNCGSELCDLLKMGTAIFPLGA